MASLLRGPAPLRLGLLGLLALGGQAFGQYQVPEMPASWKTRTLRPPPGYEMLQPSDVVIGFDWKRQPTGGGSSAPIVGTISLTSARMAPGSSISEGSGNRQRSFGGGAEVPDKFFFLGSQTLGGKLSHGWVAYVQVSSYWADLGAPVYYPNEGAGFAYGAASLEEALEQAVGAAVGNFRLLGGGRIETMHVEAGVATKPDYALYRANGTFGNLSALPFFVTARFPSDRKDGSFHGYLPQLPQEAKELVRWLLAPEQRGRKFGGQGGRFWGMNAEPYNLPRPGMARPVFLSGLQDAGYRPTSSLSEAEIKQRDETARLGLELYERSREVPAALASSLQLLREAAKLGNVAAQLQLGTHAYSRGLDPAQQQEGMAWLGAAAAQGSAAAKRTLIEALQGQPGLDPDRALREMEALAQGGELRQFLGLAWAHREGRLGLSPDPARAVEYLERGVAFDRAKVAEDSEGYRSWIMDFLAVACFRGEGIAPDLARAAQLFRDSDMEGQVQATPGDIYRAYFYATGENGFPHDPRKALELLERVYPGDWPTHQDQFNASQAAAEAALAAHPAR